MDNSLKDLEARLESLVPQGLSNAGEQRCHATIDQLLVESGPSASTSRFGFRQVACAAAALVIGIGGGWQLGQEHPVSTSISNVAEDSGDDSFELIDREAWVVEEVAPEVYVASSGEVREISREIEVTKEVVRHGKSGVVVTVETTGHHVVDSVKSDF